MTDNTSAERQRRYRERRKVERERAAALWRAFADVTPDEFLKLLPNVQPLDFLKIFPNASIEDFKEHLK